MKTALIALAAVLVTSGAALAAPGAKYGDRYGRGHINGFERAKIAQSAAHVAAVKRRAWADGRVTRYERYIINSAERRHAALIARARWN